MINVRQNLDKYWLYRAAQRTDFLVPDIAQGYSMPANWRNPGTHVMKWADATIDLGWYIGALATEHYMLSHPETFPGCATGGGDLNTVRNELYYALSAMDRVDATAEACWDPYAPDTPGFFIRDDVPATFYANFPGITTVYSDFCDPVLTNKEMSQDQVVHVLLGLSLVKKLIPSDLVVNGMNLRSAAIDRGADIVDWVHQHGWIIYNPVTNIPVNRGEDARAFSVGFNKTCVYLTDGAVDFGDTISSFYEWVWSTLSSPSNPAYDNRNNRHMAMSLAATGNGWGDSTLDDLMSLADAYDWYAYVMLYAALYDSIPQSRPTWAGHQATFNGLVQAMLNLAPSIGPPHCPLDEGEFNTGWCGSRKFIITLDAQNNGDGAPGEWYNGSDYLLLHNLFYLVTPSPWQGPSPPGQATSPSPANGATGVGISPTLGWTAGPAATSHDVYFGTTNPPPFQQNQTETSYTPGTLSESTTHYWRIDEKNSIGTTSGTVWSFTTANLPPAPVTNFTATPGDMRVTLTWTNPTGDFTGTLIRFKTTGFPTSVTDGSAIYDSNGTSCVHTGLTNGVTYYYSAWAHDAGPNYSTKAAASATTTYCFEDMFTYADGNLNGNGEWTGSADSEIQVSSQAVTVNGGAGVKDATRATSCADPGLGYIVVRVKIKKGLGDTTMWSLYIDDPSGLNLARWYGTGTTARGRIGGTADVTATQSLTGVWDELKVKIVPSANTSEFFFNGVSIGTLSHASQGAGDVVGRLRFERADNSGAAGHYVYFDDLRIGEVDTIPPGPVTSFTATPGDTQNALSWANPADPDYAGTMIRFSTVGYPGSPTGGSLCYNGSGTSYAHTGLTNGLTYYYSAFAYDEIPNYAGPATASAVPVASFCFRDEFDYANGALVGQGGWTGDATVSHIEVIDAKVRVWGGSGTKNATKTVNCNSFPTGFIWVRLLAYPGAGTSTMWNVWINDASGKNLARWYGSGTTARGRIGNTSIVTASQTLRGGGLWDSLVVKIDPAANTSQFFFNGGDLGVYSHSSTGAGDVVGQIKIERENNAAASGTNMYLDDIRIGPN